MLSQDRSTVGAVGRVLAAISGSGFELQPVLDQIAAESRILCGADTSFCFLLDGDVFRFAAASGGDTTHWEYERAHPNPIDRESIVGRVALEGRAVQIPDLAADEEYASGAYKIGRYRTLLGVPIGAADNLIGAFGLGRYEVNPFTEDEIALVTVFADQAAVAIRLARLLSAGHEAQDRETSLAAVLASIARTSFDLPQVLQAVVEEAARLCESDTGNIAVRDGDHYRVVAFTGFPEAYRDLVRGRHYVPERISVIGRVLLEEQVVHIADVLTDPDYALPELQAAGGYRSGMGVPIWYEGSIVGVIATGRSEVRPYSEREVAVIQNFADQVAIAINLARLLNESREALQRQSAVGEVLQSIASSQINLQDVLQTVIDKATLVSHADEGNIIWEEGGRFQVAAYTEGVPEAFREVLRERLFQPDRGTLTGRVLMERRPVQIEDALNDPEYTFRAAQQAAGFRTALGVPVMRDEEPFGVLAVWRREVRPFTDQEIELVTTFADQIGIAAKLVSLLTQTSTALERESAVSKVLAAIARSTFDLDLVLQTVIDSAARLANADDGNIVREEAGSFGLTASFTAGVPDDFRAFIGARRFQAERGSAMGRALMELRPVQIVDVLDDPEYTLVEAQRIAGFRTILGIPLIHDGAPVGVLSVWRYEVRPFSQAEIALLGTFADQAAIAIANARLFETVQRQRGELARFAPHVAGLLTTPEGVALLTGHRREISALFCDLRGFTAFAETAEPEELFNVLREYHAAVGAIAIGNGGMVEHFAGDGFMIFFNDPTPVPDHPLAAIRTALTMRERFADLAAGWHRRGYELGLGIGISVGYATLGRIGFEGRYDYAGVGAVTNLAARLSSVATAGQILISQRLHAMVEDDVEAEAVEDLSLKGFSHLVTAYQVVGLRSEARPETRV